MREIDSIALHRGDDHSDKLQVMLFNVGQGDHILLRFPSGEYGIIDFHYATSRHIVEPPCLSYFKSLKNNPAVEAGKITIAFFCISHTDKDHVKGIVETLEWFDDNGIFVRDIWLGAAQDKAQLEEFLKKKIPRVLKSARLEERLGLSKSAELFDSEIAVFFDRFNRWKEGRFGSPRYAREWVGTGEYLAEIRELTVPIENCRVVNVGPMQTQLSEYINRLNLDLVKKILGVDNSDTVDKNLMSHILRIRFGDTNLLFGGDTHRDIWEQCIPSSKQQKVYLGISAGQNHSYHHPDSETIADIRNVRGDADILVTNVCLGCLLQSSYEKEHHAWYDNYILGNLQYQKTAPSSQDARINKVTSDISNKRHELQDFGLFAYIFSIPADPSQEIGVRLALSKVNGPAECFYKGRPDKTFDGCKRAFS